MSLLNKFAKVEIDSSKSLLKGEDAEVCNAIDLDYQNAFRFYETEIEFFEINREENRYLNIDQAIENVEKYVEELSDKFVRDIVSHFSDKYKIALKENIRDAVFPKYPEYSNAYRIRQDEKEKGISAINRIQKFKIPMNKILSKIQDALAGMTLTEKAENELKENFYKNFAKPWKRDWRNNTVDPVVEVTKNRVVFERGVYVETSYSGGYRFPWSSVDSSIFFQTLSFFEKGSPDILPAFKNILSKDKMSEEFIFSEIEFYLEKVKSIRLYKNRKTVVKFQSNELANEFFKVWCKNGERVGED